MVATLKARDYQAWKPRLMPAVLASFAQARRPRPTSSSWRGGGLGLGGEPARRTTSPTWGSRAPPTTPVVLLGDIDRGGVIASLVGTEAVIDPADAAMIVGFIVNRFRGDPSLFCDGMRADRGAGRGGRRSASCRISPRCGKAPGRGRARASRARVRGGQGPSGGGGAGDAAHRQFRRPRPPAGGSRASRWCWCQPGTADPGATPPWCLLPGSKTTIDDLDSFSGPQGWDVDLRAHVRRGGRVLGPLRRLPDARAQPRRPARDRGRRRRTVPGLGLLDVETVMTPEKRLEAVTGDEPARSACAFSGYEMHVGDDARAPMRCARLLRLSDGRPDGAVSADGLRGGHLRARAVRPRRAARGLARPARDRVSDGAGYEAGVEAALDGLARHIAAHVDCDRLPGARPVDGPIPRRAQAESGPACRDPATNTSAA